MYCYTISCNKEHQNSLGNYRGTCIVLLSLCFGFRPFSFLLVCLGIGELGTSTV